MKESKKEERISGLLHVFGVLLALIGSVAAIIHSRSSQNPIHFLAFLLYSFGLCFLYLMSSLYHGIQNKRIKPILERFDYIAIYIMIAGSYSPIILIMLEKFPILSWTMFVAIWVIALTNSVITFMWVRRIGIIQICNYAIISLASLLLIPIAYQIMGLPIILYTLLGGLFFIAGLYFFAIAKFRYHHTIWHVFVLIGSIIHYITLISFL